MRHESIGHPGRRDRASSSAALPAKPTATTNPDLQYQPHKVTRYFRTLSREMLRNIPVRARVRRACTPAVTNTTSPKRTGQGQPCLDTEGRRLLQRMQQAPERLVQVWTSHPKRKTLMIEEFGANLVCSRELVQGDVCRKAARYVRRGSVDWC